jgi:hypothetical protein
MPALEPGRPTRPLRSGLGGGEGDDVSVRRGRCQRPKGTMSAPEGDDVSARRGRCQRPKGTMSSAGGRRSGMPPLPDHSQDAPMDQHADASVGYREPGGAKPPRLDTHHTGSNEPDWPSECSGDERQPPPASEYQAKQDQYRDHGEPLFCCSRLRLIAMCGRARAEQDRRCPASRTPVVGAVEAAARIA